MTAKNPDCAFTSNDDEILQGFLDARHPAVTWYTFRITRSFKAQTNVTFSNCHFYKPTTLNIFESTKEGFDVRFINCMVHGPGYDIKYNNEGAASLVFTNSEKP